MQNQTESDVEPGTQPHAVIVQTTATGQEISDEVEVSDVDVHGDGFLEVTEPKPDANGGSVVHRQVTDIRFLNH